MKKALALSILTSIVASTATCRASDPIIQTRFTADPAPLVYDGVVYLYTSHDEDNTPADGFLMRDWLLYTSTDMVNWTDKGTVASLRSFSWANQGYGGFENGAWAHQTIARNGKFYLYCTVQGGGIGVLVADKPEGPFKDAIGKPLIGANYDTIDPTVFIDDDGQAYLYWGNPNLWYVKLNQDMISYSGEPTKDPSIAKVAGQPDPFHYQEGPWAYKRDGHYYMAYASTCCPEGIGYSMSDKPTGPWTFKGYVMKPDARSSGNHPGIIDYKGNSYVFGFNYKLNFKITKVHHERRSVSVAEFKYNPDGTIPEVPWWDEAPAVKQLAPLNPYSRTEAETIAWSEGIKSQSQSEGAMNVYPTRDGSYLKVQGVDFGAQGAGTFTAAVSLGTKPGLVKGGTLELHLDNATGPLVGELTISYSDGQWKRQTTAVHGAAGVHDLYLVFKGESASDLLKVDYWQFQKKTAKPQLVALDTKIDRYKIDTVSDSNKRIPFVVSAIYSDGTTRDVTAKAKLQVQKPDVASISKGALIGALPGSTTLTVSYKGKTDVLPFIVKDVKTEVTPQRLVVSKTSVGMLSGKSQSFTATAEYGDTHTENVTSKATYTVANPKIATVNGGVITGRQEGTTTIHAEFQGSSGAPVVASIDVNVSDRNAFYENDAVDFTQQQGVDTENSSEGGKNASNIQNGDWMSVKALDFSTGANSLTLRVASATNGGTVEVHLDSLDGPLVGSCPVENTGGWQNWVTKSCAVKDVKGVHDVYFKFTGGDGFLFNLKWWKFTKAE